MRGAYFDAVTTTCGFLPGEMYVAVFEPHGLLVSAPGSRAVHRGCTSSFSPGFPSFLSPCQHTHLSARSPRPIGACPQDHTSEWHLVDITNPSVKIMHGKMPYAELEKMQPTELSLAAFERASVLGKKAR